MNDMKIFNYADADKTRYTTDQPISTYSLRDPSIDAIVINAPGGRQLVRLAVVDGHMTAQYDPADLDQAAQQFWQAIEAAFPTAAPRLAATLITTSSEEQA